jgi:protein TonB
LVSSVKSRRNHYEILGLKHTATDEEIAAAFAVESRKIIQNPRVNEPDIREKARQVRTAHQTLRDPAKRSAYDASLGLVIVPPVRPAEAPGEQSAPPFVAATRSGAVEPNARGLESLLRPKNVAQVSGERPVNDGPADKLEARRPRIAPGPRPQELRPPRETPPHGEAVFVAPIAPNAKAAPGRQPLPDPQSQSPPEPARPAHDTGAPFVARSPGGGATAKAADSSTVHAPRPAAQHHSAEPEAVDLGRGFGDPGMGTRSLYGERRWTKPNRTAAAAMAALLVALAVVALWMWPSGRSVEPLSRTQSGPAMAAADGSRTAPSAMDGLPSGESATGVENPFAVPELADAGSYESLTFTDDSPLPAIGRSTAGSEAPAGAVANGAIDTPAVSSEQATETVVTTAPAPVAPSAAVGQATPVAGGTQVVANVPVRPQPAPDLRPVTPAKLVRGSLLNSDNRRGAFQGTVSVRFTVGTSGRATGCRPTSGSGDARLDAYTCELVQQRLQFSPALTAQGKPVASDIGATYTWGRKRRSITGRVLDLIR